MYYVKGEKEEAIHHFKTSLEVAFPRNRHDPLSWISYASANVFCNEGEFKNADAHIGQAKSYATDAIYFLGLTNLPKARIWHRRRRLKDTTSEALGALEMFGRLGEWFGYYRNILRHIEQSRSTVGEPEHSGEYCFGTTRCPALVNFLHSAYRIVRHLWMGTLTRNDS
jgi:tetratricopeptide (TPR) repeat protein